MNIEKYIEQKKELHDQILLFFDDIESEKSSEKLLKLINEKISEQKIEDNREELHHLICLLVNMANNYNRHADFFNKLEKIIELIEPSILNNMTNIEIYQLFESNKRLLLLLIKRGTIVVDKDISFLISNKTEKNGIKYLDYFKPEIKGTKKESDSFNLEEFERKRLEGENDSEICSLIRQDSIDEFIIYVNKNNYQLSSQIEPSIFETNLYLNENKTTLIEYAAFFGSIQIFKYLENNGIRISESTWLYAVHSRNPEIISLFEDRNFKLDDEIFKESIKCHHNNVADYIENSLFGNNETSFDEQIFNVILESVNYSYFPTKFDQDYAFISLCQYNYYRIVDLLLESKKDYIESKIIFTIFLIRKFCNYII